MASRVGHSIVRDVLARILRRVPPDLLQGLRYSYSSSPPGSIPAKLASRALEIARHAGIPADVDTFRVDSKPPLLLAAGDSLVLQRLYWFGERGWEHAVVRWWTECVAYASSVAELGANVGYYAALAGASRPDLRYVAVEPHPVSAVMLRRNLLLNRIENVRVVEAAAVHDDRRVVKLSIPRADHFAAPAGAFVGTASELNEVPAATLAVAAISFRDLAEDVDLVKLDVEGQEYQLLRSAREVLMQNRAVLLIELLDDAQLLRTLILDICEENSYVAAQPMMDALRIIPNVALATTAVHHRMGTRDILLLPAEHPLAHEAVR